MGVVRNHEGTVIYYEDDEEKALEIARLLNVAYELGAAERGVPHGKAILTNT